MSAEVRVIFTSENREKNDLLPTKLAKRWLIYTCTKTKKYIFLKKKQELYDVVLHFFVIQKLTYN